MAKEPRRDQSLDELKREIARSRDRVGHDLMVVRRELDFPGKIKRSFQQQTAAWVTAAVVVGALIVFLPARRKKVYVEPKQKRKRSQTKLMEAGFALGALKFAATLLRPVILSLVKEKLRGYMREPEPARRRSFV